MIASAWPFSSVWAIGTLVGFVMGQQVVRSLGRAEETCFSRTFEHVPDRETIVWQDPARGAQYQVMPVRTAEGNYLNSVISLGVEWATPRIQAEAEKAVGVKFNVQLMGSNAQVQKSITDPKSFDVGGLYNYQFFQIWPTGNFQPVDTRKLKASAARSAAATGAEPDQGRARIRSAAKGEPQLPQSAPADPGTVAVSGASASSGSPVAKLPAAALEDVSEDAKPLSRSQRRHVVVSEPKALPKPMSLGASGGGGDWRRKALNPGY